MEGERAFVGEVDTIMGIPFRVGCDGKTCWWLRRNEVVVTPFEAIEKNLCFCNPFDAYGSHDAAKVLRDRGLTYEGKASAIGGRLCDVFRSFEPGDPARHMPAMFHSWKFDAETHRVASVGTLMAAFGRRSSYSMEFAYTGINEPIPEETFHPPSGMGKPTARKEPEPMKEGYAPLPQGQRRQQRSNVGPLGDGRAERDDEQRTELRDSLSPCQVRPEAIVRHPSGERQHSSKAEATSLAVVLVPQAEGCHPASAQSSPLTAELQIMK